jgi:hypothetical protein
MLGPCGLCLYSYLDAPEIEDAALLQARWICHRHPPVVQPEEKGFRINTDSGKKRYVWNPSDWPNVFPKDGCYEFKMAPWKKTNKWRMYKKKMPL